MWQQRLRTDSAKATFIVGALLTLPGALTSPASPDQQARMLDRRHSAGGHRFQPRDHDLARGPMLAFAIVPERTPAAIELAKA